MLTIVTSEDDMMIEFDAHGESDVFEIGEDRLFFRQRGDSFPICVAHAATGEPYSRSNQYIDFRTLEDAERFLAEAQAQQGLPYGWQ